MMSRSMATLDHLHDYSTCIRGNSDVLDQTEMKMQDRGSTILKTSL